MFSYGLFVRAHSRFSRFLFLTVIAVSPASAQAPILQDGATALRQARLDWTLGQEPLGPSSMPSFEVGYGGAGSEGPDTPLLGGEGLGPGRRGSGLGLQGRLAKGPWSFGVTALALRDQGHTAGLLQRGCLAFQAESGWRLSLEQSPLAWGVGLNGGDLLGDGARAFPRLSLATPRGDLSWGCWGLEAFLGRLEGARPVPQWIPQQTERQAAQAAGLDLHNPRLAGALLRAGFGSFLELSLGTLRLEGGTTASGASAPPASARATSLAEMRLRLPALARLAKARGASFYVSRSAAPESAALTLTPGRTLGGLQLVWEGSDLAAEYAGGAPAGRGTFEGPAHLAGLSLRGDALGPAFGPGAITRTVELGLPLFLEGQGRLKLVRATVPMESAPGRGAWILQGQAQWRTPTGKLGATLASRRDDGLEAPGRWGWSFAVFQAFRVF